MPGPTAIITRPTPPRPTRRWPLPRAGARLLWALTTACGLTAVAGCMAGAPPPVPDRPVTAPAPLALDGAVRAALADASRRSGLAVDALQVLGAEAVTWSDGSLGCPQPGMMYTQALVPGFRIQVRAGSQTLDYHAGRFGAPVLCPAGRALKTLPGAATR